MSGAAVGVLALQGDFAEHERALQITELAFRGREVRAGQLEAGQREQGISKAGNVRVRTLAVEMAWVWLRFQPQSKLSQWYMQRFGEGGKLLGRMAA